MREWKSHSYEKLSILTDYLEVFAKASSRAPNRVYLDAFAGDTVNRIQGTDRTFPGSAETALAVDPPFTHIRLFELAKKRAGRLSALVAARPNAQVIRGDCNLTIPAELATLPVKAPTFAFLDPDGMELEWATVKALADHKRDYAEQFGKSKVEMWILFSTSGMVRMLGKNRDAVGENRLLDKAARLYGASGPFERVWDAKLAGEITGGEAQKAYLFLYMDRLADLGYRHLLVRPIRGSRGQLYAMVFASDHPAGANIMQWAQERDRVRPRADTLFDVPESRPAYEDLHTEWRSEFPIELPPWTELA
ncbi:MAG: three-Cys-motif partner protein TcmP [Microthrixaceae bacterium]